MPAITCCVPDSRRTACRTRSACCRTCRRRESTCIGAQEPPFGVPSIRKRAPSRAIMRFHVSGCSSRIGARPRCRPSSGRRCAPAAASASRAASAASTASARRRASSSIGRRQSKANGMTSWRVGEALDQIVVDDCRSGRRARRVAAVVGSQRELLSRPLTKRKPSQMRLPSTFRLRAEDARQHEYRRPIAAPPPRRRRRASAPPRARRACRSTSSPAQESGPIAREFRRLVLSISALDDRLHRALVG